MSDAHAKPPAHYNPTPKFGLVTHDVIFERECAAEWRYMRENSEGWCIDCGEEFHSDDCGGYNPPCSCGLHCRSCHEAEIRDMDDYDDDYEDD
jgi:hypothetical protein